MKITARQLRFNKTVLFFFVILFLSKSTFAMIPQKAVIIGKVRQFDTETILIAIKSGTIKVPRSTGPKKVERDQDIRAVVKLTDLAKIN